LTNRQRAILEKAQAALAAASTSSEMPPKTPISQTAESDPSALMDQLKRSPTFVTEKRMVTPGSRDAPRFKSTHPEELRRFIRLMEDLWVDHGIIDDQTKKTMIGKYADQDSEEEWHAFETFGGTHSWIEFKDELLENYPEAAAAERGTPARLREICSEATKAGKLVLGDMVSFYTFRRSFVSEGKKLREAPAVMANRELVELFVGCLSDTFASAVLQYLGNKSPDPKAIISKANDASSNADDVKPRRPEDKYDWKEVCKAALQVSENSQGMFGLINKTEQRGVMLFSQPVSETKALNEKLSELEGEQALDKDRLVSLGKTLEARMGGIEDLIKSLMKNGKDADAQNNCKGDGRSGNCRTHEATSNSTPMQKWGGKSYDNEKCFWCGLLGHFQADCEDLQNQVRSGNVKMNHEGKPRLRDGSFIPKFPLDATLKERVEKHYARRPSQFFYGEYDDVDPAPSAATSVLSQLLGTRNDADKRTIVQLKAELDLRKREEALELKQRMLEKSDKMAEQTSGSTRTANVLELLGQLSDEELAAIKAAKSSFV
jgi:hypothetical protein